MHVRFKNGTVHAYADVPAEVRKAFHEAPSKGSHFAQHIRGKFTSRKVEPEPME